jgi:hypothetical protein
MNNIDVKRLGFAVGTTLALLHLGCLFVMATAGEAGTILFFNSLLHGLDVTHIIRMNISLSEALMGFVEIFVLGWLAGATIAAIYNASLKK